MSTTTSPVLPEAPGWSPTASATSPWRSASASTASATDSSKLRPLAVPRSRSAPTSSSLSFSSRSAWSSFWRSPSCWSSARCVACWRLAAWLIDSSAPALKSASGFDPSAAENWRTRSWRERTSASLTSSRTRFCTEAELPSPKSFSRSRASWPVSGPKTSSTLVPKCSATVRALSVNWLSTSRDTRSNSVFTYSALAAACSRSSTRAPISIASRTVLTGSSPACSRSRTSRTAHSSCRSSSRTTSRSPTTATWDCLSGVAASIVVWSHRRGGT